MTEAVVKHSIADIQAMAKTVVDSRLFPSVKTDEAAACLLLLCQAEGLHPMTAMRRYDLIQGRPALKSDAMLAEFQARGGTVEWLEMTDEQCVACFRSPGSPDGAEIKWTMDMARNANLAHKDNWKNYPRAMLRARTISEGVRATLPAAVVGLYTPEETEEFPVVEPPVALPEPKSISGLSKTGPIELDQVDIPESVPMTKPAPVEVVAKSLDGAVLPYPPLPYMGEKPPWTRDGNCRLELWSKSKGQGNNVWQIPYPDGKTLKDLIKDAYWMKWGKEKDGKWDYGFCWFRDQMNFEQSQACAEWILSLPCPFDPRQTLSQSLKAKIAIWEDGHLAWVYPKEQEEIEQPADTMPMDEGSPF